jgi:hypothetical protein
MERMIPTNETRKVSKSVIIRITSMVNSVLRSAYKHIGFSLCIDSGRVSSFEKEDQN